MWTPPTRQKLTRATVHGRVRSIAGSCLGGTTKSLARRYLELHDEIADLDTMTAVVDELAPDNVTRNSIGHIGAAQLLLTAGGRSSMRPRPKPLAPA